MAKVVERVGKGNNVNEMSLELEKKKLQIEKQELVV